MFSKLREILLTQYIGAILVALLVWQAAFEVITVIVRAGFWLFNHRQTESVFGGSSSAPFPWDSLVFSVVTVLLYLLTAYGLVRWLYPTEPQISPSDAEGESSEPSPEQGEHS